MSILIQQFGGQVAGHISRGRPGHSAPSGLFSIALYFSGALSDFRTTSTKVKMVMTLSKERRGTGDVSWLIMYRIGRG